MTLFLRSRKGMQLTPDGEALLQFCNGSRELEGQFIGRTQGNNRQEVSLTLVGPTSAIATRIADDVKPLYEKYSFLRLHLRSDDHSDRIELVRRGDADFAVVSPEQVPNEMDSKLLKPDRYLLVASHKWKGRRLTEILEAERVIDFYESDQTTEDYLRGFGMKAAKSRIFVNENEALIRMFIAGVGFGTLTESVADPHLKNGSLISLNRGQTMQSPLALAWYPRPQKAAYFSDLLKAIR
ncbi:MAG: LysR family transcriptional regulator [Bdellovibrionaceae bacterium]|nr:LysR family transcriptional regulator [Pseudobdellovibrionaceae bacterium]